MEKEIFKKLFEAHYENLVGFVFGFVRDEEVAKDIVHDTFLTFWTKRKQLDLSYSAKSYLFTLAQNYALNYLRHQRVVELHAMEASQQLLRTSEPSVEPDERLARIKQRLERLPEKQREAVMKCVVEEKKYKEAAEEMNVSLNTIKKHLARAMKSLRDES